MNDISIVPNYSELYHHGIKGQKWGIRRFQNKNGSLTNLGRKRYSSDDGTLNVEGQKLYNAKKSELENKKKILQNKANTRQQLEDLKTLKKEVSSLEKAEKKAQKAEKKAAKEEKHEERDAASIEKKREKLLNSNDAEFIYKNKDLLTTQELQDRINRINTEANLASKIPQQKSAFDFVNSALKKTATTIDNVNNTFKSVDKAYKDVSESKIGKTLKKALGIETKKKEFNYEKELSKIDTMTNEEVQAFKQRAVNENTVRMMYDKIKEAKASTSTSDSNNTFAYEAGKKAVENYNKNWYENDKSAFESANKSSGVYSKVGKDIVDNITKTSESLSGHSEAIGIAQKYVAGYLEDYSRYLK